PLAEATIPMLIVSAKGDRICPPAAARPAFLHLPEELRSWWVLDEGWGHLDVIAGQQASTQLNPRLIDWVSAQRWRCCNDRSAAHAS
ncbi:MAG: hypothetical protein AAFV53_25440, partial [Myxococcota bacterium]